MKDSSALEVLFRHRLIIISGKGGVGKTTVSSALGYLAACRNLKTLIVEVNAPERLASLFQRLPIGYQETELISSLFAFNVDPHLAFQEYILEQIHSRRLYQLVFENRLVRAFMDATPGLQELLEIGKIWSLVNQQTYDLVIVDAPATGHGLALLDVPRVVAEAVRLGPLKNKAQKIIDLIRDPLRTALVLVTLPEEMPVNETLEMVDKAQNQIQVGVKMVVVNGRFPPVLRENKWDLFEQKLASAVKNHWVSKAQSVLSLYHRRVEFESLHVQKLKDDLKNIPLLSLPYLFLKSWNFEAVAELSKSIRSNIQ